jgi:hypothetical protein
MNTGGIYTVIDEIESWCRDAVITQEEELLNAYIIHPDRELLREAEEVLSKLLKIGNVIRCKQLTDATVTAARIVETLRQRVRSQAYALL